MVHVNETEMKRAASFDAALFMYSWCGSGVAVEAALEVRVCKLRIRHREVDVLAVRASLVELAGREDVVLGALVLADEATEVAQALAAAELPEGLLTEERVDCFVLRCRHRQCRHRRVGQVA